LHSLFCGSPYCLHVSSLALPLVVACSFLCISPCYLFVPLHLVMLFRTFSKVHVVTPSPLLLLAPSFAFPHAICLFLRTLSCCFALFLRYMLSLPPPCCFTIHCLPCVNWYFLLLFHFYKLRSLEHQYFLICFFFFFEMSCFVFFSSNVMRRENFLSFPFFFSFLFYFLFFYFVCLFFCNFWIFSF
jgi:hypothetical protein